jgi:hypothetical protein
MRQGKEFTPKKGSFWLSDHKSPTIAYIADPKDDTQCIGKVTRVRPKYFRAALYDGPVPFTTTRKEAPPATIYRFLPTWKQAAEWLQRNARSGNTL